MLEVILNPKAGKPTFKFDYSGFQWDLPNGTVTLAKPERTECLLAIEQGLSSPESLNDPEFMQDLVAKLIHASHVIVRGRSHLRHLLDAFLGSEQSLSASRGKQIKFDLDWWQTALCCENNTTSVVKAGGSPVQIEVYTDASTKGGCAIIDGESKSWKWNDGVVIGIPLVSWAEATAIEIAVRDLVTRPKVKRATFRIQCDSESVIRSWMVGGSKQEQVNRVIVSIVRVLVEHKCWITLEKICSSKNPADTPSRSGMSTHGGTLDAFLHPDTREYLL